MSAQFETFGKYVLLEKLATGGMAEVFLARGSGAGGIGKFFAIKRILPQYVDSPEFIEMFKDEAKIAINLSHSNIVSIHEFGVEKGQFFLVMDYVEGRNLRQILNKMKKSALQFSIDQIVYIIKEVAAGLDHAHRCIDGTTGKPLNITHRDMSPQNVMVSFEGEVRIVDFGIAKAESQLETTRAGTLKGKFGYMSPEQAEGQQVDLRTDIFSLGIVTWELLANDRLFVANNEINTLRKIRDCQIPSLRKVNPNIHTELERIVQKALARDRNLRYQTGAALHRDLNRFLNRQYPDFSSQDFAVFIKSVFSDEILSLRKRQVEYSKINLQVDLTIPKNRDTEVTATSLLDKNTDSLVLTQSGTENSVVNFKNPEDDSLNTDAGISQSGHSKVDIDEMTKTIRTDSSISTETRASNEVLDDEALEAEARRGITVSNRIKPMETKVGPAPVSTETKISEPLKTEELPGLQPGLQRRARSVAPGLMSGKSSKEKRQPVRFATFAVFALLCLSVYSYLAKYFPEAMSPVIAMTDPVLGPLHAALGLQKEAEIEPTQVSTENVFRDISPEISINSQSSLTVTSNPSGAEIFVNERNTGLVTPSQVKVNNLQTFTITLRKKGYAEFVKTNVTRETLGSRLDASMQKLNTASLDVEIFPPQEAVLFVNGKPVPLMRGLAREITIPAGQPIKVRAESPSNKTFEEITVTVPVDKRKTVQMNPRKQNRIPSNSR